MARKRDCTKNTLANLPKQPSMPTQQVTVEDVTDSESESDSDYEDPGPHCYRSKGAGFKISVDHSHKLIFTNHAGLLITWHGLWVPIGKVLTAHKPFGPTYYRKYHGPQVLPNNIMEALGEGF